MYPKRDGHIDVPGGRMTGDQSKRPSRALSPAGIVILVGVVALALFVRFEDPLSSPVMATEDPYTHLVFTREHMDRGHFEDSYHMGTTLYPPGMHGFLGIFWTMSGVDLYDFMRLSAPLFGGLAALGTFLLAHRFGGAVVRGEGPRRETGCLAAGATAGTLVALIPEHVIRTNFFVPTALDLALVPFYLWAVMEVLDTSSAQSRLAWGLVALAIGAALTVSHPWIMPLTAAPIALYAATRFLVTRSRARDEVGLDGTGARGLALGIVVPAALLFFAAKTRWKQSDSGIGDIAEDSSADIFAAAFAAVFNVYLVVTLLVGGLVVALLARKGRTSVAAWTASAVIALSLFITIPVLTAYLPAHVEYETQLGWPAIWIGLAGAVVLPLYLDNRVGQMGAAIALVTFPLTAVNFFQSAYLPHRTVAYLTIGIALLGAGVAALLARALGDRWTFRSRTRAERLTGAPNVAMSGLVVVAVAGLMMGPSVPEPEEWYRYYTPEEFAGFEFAADLMREQPNAVVVSGDWRPNMVLKALSPELGRAWYAEDFYQSPEGRHRVTSDAAAGGYAPYVIVERYVTQSYGGASWAGGYEPVWTCECGNITVYRVTGGGG